MNKKVLAVAVVAAMSASAAQADVKFFGGVQAEMITNTGTKASTGMHNGGYGQFGAKWSDGIFSGKLNIKTTLGATGTKVDNRDNQVAIKVGPGKVVAGDYVSIYRATGMSTMSTTSLGSERSAGKGGYVSALGYRGTAGSVKYGIDYNPGNANMAIGVTAGLGNITVFGGIDSFKGNGGNAATATVAAKANESTTNIGAIMKLGAMKVAASIETNQIKYKGKTKDSLTMVNMTMPMGGMTMFASVTIADDTGFTGGVKKSVSKKTFWYAGAKKTSTKGSDTGLVLGLRTNF